MPLDTPDQKNNRKPQLHPTNTKPKPNPTRNSSKTGSTQQQNRPSLSRKTAAAAAGSREKTRSALRKLRQQQGRNLNRSQSSQLTNETVPKLNH